MLPPDCREVWTAGDEELAAFLRTAGVALVDDPARAEALIIDLDAGEVPDATLEAVRGADPAAVIGVAVRGGARGVPERVSRLQRAVELTATPIEAVVAARSARAAAARLRPALGTLDSMPTGDRSRLHGLGVSALRSHRRMPLGWILHRRSPDRRSAARAAVAAAAAAAGEPLEVHSAQALLSGKLLVELRGARGGRYVLRLAGDPARAALDRSLRALTRLAAEAADQPVLAERIVFPLHSANLGLVSFVIDERRAGAPPRVLHDRFRMECLGFLVALRDVSADPPAAAGGWAAASSAQIKALSTVVDDRGGAALMATGARLRELLGTLPLGWVHGDFWHANLLSAGRRLTGVVDWEWSEPRGLPLLDLFDFVALGSRRSRSLEIGPRFRDVVLPFARSQDAELREYCARTGLPADPAVLEAAAVAYYVDRAARSVQDHGSGRLRQAHWTRANVVEPLEALERWAA